MNAFQDAVWLAPLTKGGHLPFRRWCVALGAQVTVGEMAVVKRLFQRRGSEFALLRSHPDEPCFGAQLADRAPESLSEAAKLAEQRGARFVDLNCGCPIHEMTNRGLGASLLRKPARLGRLVSAMVSGLSVPVTVKLRTGWSEAKPNVSELARVCEESGAAAITVHGRSREQRYNRTANWDLIGRVAAERSIPVIGNGDILTHYEARDRMRQSGVRSVMIGRGALTKPWIFREIREGRDLSPDATERLGLLSQFVELMREHFGSDERGHKRIGELLTWHLGFLCRYRHLPEAEHLERSREHPLIQTRWALDPGLSPLERLLADPRAETHAALAGALLAAADVPDLIGRADQLAEGLGDVPGDAPAELSAAIVAG